MRFFDCHMHIPVRESAPVEKLLCEVDRSGMSGFVLILNTEVEKRIFIRNYSKFEPYNFRVAKTLNLNLTEHTAEDDAVDELDLQYYVKLHPRLNNITRGDFAMVHKLLAKERCTTVIVDDWKFGPRLDNHIGTELALYLAHMFPEKQFVIAHSGGYKLIETMLLTRPVKNIFYDLSLTQTYFTGCSLDLDVDYFMKWTVERVVFGSDYPDFTVLESWEAFQRHASAAGVGNCLRKTQELAMRLYGFASESKVK